MACGYHNLVNVNFLRYGLPRRLINSDAGADGMNAGNSLSNAAAAKPKTAAARACLRTALLRAAGTPASPADVMLESRKRLPWI